MEGFQISVSHKGYLGHLSFVRDVIVFLEAVIVWFGDSDQ